MTKTYETKDYSIFKIRDDNRALCQKHIEKLMHCIQEKNLLEHTPLIVNSSMELIDGQHRLAAARELNLKVYYQIIENFDIEDLLKLNVSKKWTITDYLHYFVSHHYIDYIKFRDIANDLQLPLSTVLEIVGSRCEGTYKDFKQGKYKFNFTEEKKNRLALCKDIVNLIEELQGKQRYIRSVRFNKALLHISGLLAFDANKLKYNITRLSNKLGARATIPQYIENICQIHNWKNHTPIKLNEEFLHESK